MNQDIIYTGINKAASDHQVLDGTLEYATNFINENAYLKAMDVDAEETIFIKSGFNVKFIHDGRYIIQHPHGGYCYATKEKLTEVSYEALDDSTSINGLYEITSLGNTLIFFTESSAHYYLWKDNKYKYLGNHIPELNLTFGLYSKIEATDKIDIGDALHVSRKTLKFDDNDKKRATELILAQVNKFINERATKKNKFIYPFFVRYALRLYDGSHTMQSPPVLMIPSTGVVPHALAYSYANGGLYIEDGGSFGFKKFRVAATVAELDMTMDSDIPYEDWTDIVHAVDIFVSQPIWSYKQGGECEGIENALPLNDFAITKLINKEETASLTNHQRQTFRSMYDLVYNQEDDFRWDDTLDGGYTDKAYYHSRIKLPSYDAETIKSDIVNVANFYHVKSLTLDEIKTGLQLLKLKEGVLNNLTAQQTLQDDFDSHDHITAQHAYTYNSRLNIANIQKKLFKGFPLSTMLPLIDQSDIANYEDFIGTTVKTEVQTEQGPIVVESDETRVASEYAYFLFYPNARATRMQFPILTFWEEGGYVPKAVEVKLTESNTLNGAYFFRGWEGSLERVGENKKHLNISADTTVKIQNKIYTSEVGNPFVFVPSNINTFQDGEIINITSAAKALSEGQFGQFPLYVFTTQGIWAMEVSDKGVYSTKQIIAREVLLNSKSLLQIDNAVVFASQRGLMLLQGAQCTRLSAELDDMQSFNFSQLPDIDRLFTMANRTVPQVLTPFNEFLKGCVMAFDYTTQRIFIGNPEYSYTWVYALKSKLWTQLETVMYSTLNTFPESEVLLGKEGYNVLIDLSHLKEEHNTYALFVTRPLKMGNPDILKTLNTVIQRGNMPEDSVKQVIYATRDYHNWCCIASSNSAKIQGLHGSPYKAFRIAVIAKLRKGEYLSGCSVEYTPKWTNKQR